MNDHAGVRRIAVGFLGMPANRPVHTTAAEAFTPENAATPAATAATKRVLFSDVISNLRCCRMTL
jgi:hypothetical protein